MMLAMMLTILAVGEREKTSVEKNTFGRKVTQARSNSCRKLPKVYFSFSSPFP